jgi:GDP-L-fucose synthase
MRVIVTGGSGLVGSALREIRPDWTYIDSRTYGSLTEIDNVKEMFKGRPDVVIHLAANVGGLFKNMNKRLEMFEDNIRMNTNVLSEAAKNGTRRVVTMLSTCIFPDGLVEALTPEALHKGPPHFSNEGYAYAKRVSEVHARIINETTGTRVTCLVPTNVYGPHDNFSLEDGHVVPALIHKAHIAKKNGERLQVRGTGVAKRQFIHSSDLARIIAWAAESPEDPPPMIVCCAEEEYTIGHVAKVIAEATGVDIEFVPGADGQMRKTAVPGPGDFPPTQVSLEVGLKSTVEWFRSAQTHRL